MRTKRRNRERRKTESERQPAKPKARLRTQIITQAPGAPGKPKAPPKGPPGAKNTPSAKGKGKGGPKQGDGKVPSKSPSSGKNAPKGPPPAKTPAGAKAPCLFWPIPATAGQIARLLMTHRSHLKPVLKPQVPFPQLLQPQPLQLCCHQQVHMQLSQRHLELVNHCLPGPVSGGSSVALRVGFLFFLLPFQMCDLPGAAQHFLAFNPAPSM